MSRPSHPSDDQPTRTTAPETRPETAAHPDLPMVAGMAASAALGIAPQPPLSSIASAEEAAGVGRVPTDVPEAPATHSPMIAGTRAIADLTGEGALISPRKRRGPASARVRDSLPVVAGMAAIAALLPAREIWPAQLALLILLLSIPGIALLGALRVPQLSIAGTPIYVPVASLAMLMVAGVTVDLCGPRIRVDTPLRTVPLLVGVEGVCAVLVAVSAVRTPIRLRQRTHLALPRAQDLWPLALPLASAAGAARLTTGYGPGVAVAATSAAVAAVLVAVLAAPRLSRAQMSFLIYGIGLALAWSFTLRSGFVYGFDISAEYHVAQSTQAAGLWNLAHPNDAYGAMLSLTVLPAVLRNLGGLSDLTILKVVYPAVVAVFPVAIFMIARRFVAPRYATLAAVLVIVQGSFFLEVPEIARQEIALVALAVLIAVLVDTTMPQGPRFALAAVLSLMLVVSHYSTTDFAIVMFGTAILVQLAVSTFRPLRRGNTALIGAFIVLLAGAVLWYGPLTNSASNVAAFRQAVMTEGFQFLPNRTAGESLVTAYLNGNTTPQLSAAQYAALSAQDYAKNHPYVRPLPNATSPRYDLQDASVPSNPPLAPKIESGLGVITIIFQELLYLVAGCAALALAIRRRSSTSLRVVGFLGIGTLAVLAAIRLSGTIATFYGQERVLIQALVPLSVGAAWALQSGARRMRRLASAGVAVIAVGAAILLMNASGLTGATLGSGTTGNLANHGEDYERFYITTPELAAAAWLGSVAPRNAFVYADRYGQLPLVAETLGQWPLLLDITPRTLDQHAWVYASATNVISGRARGVTGGSFGLYQFPSLFLADNFNTVYANGSSEVFHR